MTDVRPELVFVSGPQANERVVLMSNVSIAGRSPDADVRLMEEYASRRQMRFVLTGDGWVMENLSGNGTLVNGKRFRSRKKKILLATGDVLGVGRQTRILFVAPGDDPDEALRAYRLAHPPQEPPAAETEAPLAAAKAQGPQGEPSPVAPEPPKTEKPPAPGAEEADEARQRAEKLKKYAVYFGVYLAFIVGLIALLTALRGGPERLVERAALLTDKEIAEVLSAVPRKNPIPTRAAGELQRALSLYENLPSREGDLYRCVRSFQLHLAYKPVAAFDNVQDELKYQDALERLIKRVQARYRNAWAFEQAGDWRRSGEIYGQLMRMLPETQPGNPVFETLVRNVKDHLSYVRGKAQKKRRR